MHDSHRPTDLCKRIFWHFFLFLSDFSLHTLFPEKIRPGLMSFFGSKHPFGLIYGGCLTAGSKCTGADGACAWGGDAELRSAAVIGPTSEHEGGPTKVMREFRRGGGKQALPMPVQPLQPWVVHAGQQREGCQGGGSQAECSSWHSGGPFPQGCWGPTFLACPSPPKRWVGRWQPRAKADKYHYDTTNILPVQTSHWPNNQMTRVIVSFLQCYVSTLH